MPQSSRWLRTSLVALVVGLASACSVSLDPSATAAINCQSNAECPNGLVCLSDVGYCVSPSSACIGQTDGIYRAAPNGTACSFEGATGICNSGLCGLCGNGRRESGEECDEGANNRDVPDSCSTRCERSVCGDGRVTAGAEACDDANTNANDACASCREVEWASALAFGLGPSRGGNTRRVISAVTGIAAANDGSIYITQNAPPVGSDRPSAQQGFVLRVSQAAQALLRVAGTDQQDGRPRAASGLARETSLQSLTGIAVDPRGTIYVSEFDPNAKRPYIHSIDAVGVLRIIAGTGVQCTMGSCGDNGFARAAALRGPSALAFDQTGQLYVVDGNTVRVIDTSGYIRTVAGNGAACVSLAACPYAGPTQLPTVATDVALGSITGIAFNERNEMLIGNFYNGSDAAIDRVRDGVISHQLTGINELGPIVSTLDGVVVFAAGQPDGHLFSYNSDAKEAVAILPPSSPIASAVSVAADGAIVLADVASRSVRRVVGGVSSDVFVSPPDTAVFTGVNATSTPFPATAGAFAANGDLYLSTRTNVYVRHAASGILDSVPSTVAFQGITDLAWDGRLYVADQAANRVYALENGVASAVFGNGNREPSAAPSLPAAATTVAVEPMGLDVRDSVVTVTTRYSVWRVNLRDAEARRIVGASFGLPLRCPSDAAVAGNGDIFVADVLNCRVVRISGASASDVVTAGECGPGSEPGATQYCSPAIVPNFTPVSLALAGETLFIGDMGTEDVRGVASNKVLTVAATSTAIGLAETTVIAGANASPIDNRPALETPLVGPRILFDPSGVTYILQTDQSPLTRSVMRLTSEGNLTGVVGNIDGSLTGPFAVVGLSAPNQAARLSDQEVVIADAVDGALHRVDLSNETVDLVFGNKFGDSVSPFARYRGFLQRATSVAYDVARRTIYLGSASGILTITTQGSRDPAAWVIASSSTTVADALVYLPEQNAMDVCDSAHHVIRVDPVSGGKSQIIAGRYGFVGYSGDGGPATRALLDTPKDIVVGPKGSLYIADSGNQRVRRVDTSGVISTVIGNGTALNSVDDATLPAALHTIAQPQGLVFDAFGNLVVAGRGVVRVVLADTTSGEPDGSSRVTTIFSSDSSSSDLTQCLKTLFNGASDSEIFAGDACSGAVFRLTRQAAP